MLFVAVVTFVMHQKVHLLLNDIMVVAVEGDKRCLQGLQMHSTWFGFQNYITVIFSTEIHANNCAVLLNWIMKKQMQAEDQKLKSSLSSTVQCTSKTEYLRKISISKRYDAS